MKSNRIRKILISLICIVLVILISSIINIKLKENKLEKQEILAKKGMSESMQVSELQGQLTNLEKEKEDYATKVQSFKSAIAKAITSAGVPTSADASTSTMTTNIGKILSSSTSGTATAGDILSGKTAYVNGNKVTGTMANKGNLNWSPTTSTTYTVPAGYYSGGTLDSSGAYNAGYSAGSSTKQASVTISGTMSGSASQPYGGTSGSTRGQISIPTMGYKKADVTITWTGKWGSGSASSNVGTGNNISITSVDNVTISWNASCTHNGSPNLYNASGSYKIVLHD